MYNAVLFVLSIQIELECCKSCDYEHMNTKNILKLDYFRMLRVG